MYLIHARFVTGRGRRLPRELALLLQAQSSDAASIEYVAVHPDVPGGPVVGLFVAAADLATAERAARQACAHLLDSHPGLVGVTLASCEAALIDPFREPEGQ